MSVDNGRLSADIALMSVASHPLSSADRPLDAVPIHFHKEVRMAKRFPRTESDIATLAGRVIDGLTNAADPFPFVCNVNWHWLLGARFVPRSKARHAFQ